MCDDGVLCHQALFYRSIASVLVAVFIGSRPVFELLDAAFTAVQARFQHLRFRQSVLFHLRFLPFVFCGPTLPHFRGFANDEKAL